MKPDLSQLRDIHLPAPVSWWPPAPGWWAVLLLLLIVIGIAYTIYTRRRRNHWRKDALTELARLRDVSHERVLQDISVLLRRIAISRYPRHDVAALTGDSWLAFLDRTFDDGTSFRSGTGRVLLSGPYVNNTHVDAASLFSLCERWIKHLPSKVKGAM